jgi:hypothetical protein
MVNDLSDVLLDLFCHYFIENFCINTKTSVLEVSLPDFGMSVTLAS